MRLSTNKYSKLGGRLLALLLCAVMLAGLLPVSALAAEDEPVTVTNATYDAPSNTFEVSFDINDKATGDVTLDIGKEVTDLLIKHTGDNQMPGMQYTVKVNITNSSPDAFTYKPDGLSIGTNGGGENDDAPMTGFTGYDGNNIGLLRVGAMAFTHPAMKKLYGKTLGKKDYQAVLDTYKDGIFNAYELLADTEYKNVSTLSDYFLAWYQNEFNDGALTWDDLMDNEHRDAVIADFSKGGFNGFFQDVPVAPLENLTSMKNPLGDAFVGTKTGTDRYGNDLYEVQFKWPEETLAAFSYDLFYKDLLSVTFGGEAKPNVSRPLENTMRDRGIGDYLDHSSDAYTTAETYLKSIGEDGEIANGETASFEFYMSMDGPGTGNMYQSYVFDGCCDLSLRFKKVEPLTVKITPMDMVIYAGADLGYGGKLYITKDGEYKWLTDETVLPKPGYVIELPDEINQEFNEAFGDDAYVDLSDFLTFHYKDDQQERLWHIDTYSDDNDSKLTEGEHKDKYIYEILPDENEGIPVSLSITNKDGTTFEASKFDFSTAKPYTTYKTGIYPGVLDQSSIQATVAVGDNKPHVCNVVIGEGTLDVRGITEEGDTVDLAKGQNGVISYEAPADNTYYMNELPFTVAEGDVDVLVDELPESDASMESATRALDKFDIPENAEMDFLYIDLVDGNNGDVWVTTENDLTFTWAYPADCDRNGEFQIIHYGGMDRNYTNAQAAWNTANIHSVDITKTTDGIQFQAGEEGFSPFALVYSKASTGGGGGGGGGSTRYTLKYVSNGGTEYKDEKYSPNTVVQLDKTPTREGYTFTGWYADKELTDRITTVKMTSDKTVYAGWEITGVPEWLNGDDHFAYVIGYPDGNVRPLANITRAEATTIFFRLLKPEIRDGNLTDKNSFDDVKPGAWYNKAVSTLTDIGIVKGRTATTFAPDAPITRAEFAAICARFDTGLTDGESDFTDISGHWAEAEIKRAASLGWIRGYADGTFRPDQSITRAEAMTMINRVLCRLPETEGDLLTGMNVWPDNQPGSWYYLAVQEATNSHNWQRKGGIYETWTSLTADPNWTRYER